MKKGKLIIFSGSSGVGKRTILQQLLKDEKLNLKYSVSLTTRQPRENEIDAIDYHFVDNKTFDKYIEENKLIEWAQFVDHKYGTPIDYIYECINAGHNIILEIEVQGALKIFDTYKGEYTSIFIIAPSLEELKLRLSNRNTETKEQIDKRILESQKEIKFKNHYQNIVINNNLENCIEEIREILLNGK